MIIATPNFFKNRIGAIILTIFSIIIFFYIAVQSLEKWVLIYPIISILFLLRLYLIDINTIITVDKDRSVLKFGVFSKSTIEVKHTDVKTIYVRQSFFGRIFNIGNVGIVSAEDIADLVIKGIDQYLQIKDFINENRKKRESEVSSHGSDNISKIAQLNDLKEKGVLSNEEFETKKKELLKNI